MERRVGFGVIADNLINIGRFMEEAAEPQRAPATIGFLSPPAIPSGLCFARRY
jgi:hypothetical protein